MLENFLLFGMLENFETSEAIPMPNQVRNIHLAAKPSKSSISPNKWLWFWIWIWMNTSLTVLLRFTILCSSLCHTDTSANETREQTHCWLEVTIFLLKLFQNRRWDMHSCISSKRFLSTYEHVMKKILNDNGCSECMVCKFERNSKMMGNPNVQLRLEWNFCNVGRRAAD